MRLVVVSDSHLSPSRPDGDRNWSTVVDHVERLAPDLVVHGGDISADGVDDPDDLTHARHQLDRLAVPWRAVPGNHDLGNPGDDPDLVEPRRRRYEEVFGPRFWSVERGGWRLVGLDSQALEADHPDDEPSWRWTAEQLAGDLPIAVFQHRPLAPTAEGEFDTPKRYHTDPGRTRLRELLAGSPVRVVVSGHVHQWRDQAIGGIRFLWAPATWARLPDAAQPVIGTKVVGLVELDLGPGGGVEASVVSAGFEQAVVDEAAPRPPAYR